MAAKAAKVRWDFYFEFEKLLPLTFRGLAMLPNRKREPKKQI